MIAGIIAAGAGERLGGADQPKPLRRVAGRPLIDHVLDGLQAAGITEVVCIVNESAGAVPEHVRRSGRRLPIEWIVRSTPSSMHSFLAITKSLSERQPGLSLVTTVDAVAAPSTYRRFAESFRLFPQADAVLGLTSVIDDEKPLRVAMKGAEETGVLPADPAQDAEAFAVVALSTTGFASEWITSGFYGVTPELLALEEEALARGCGSLRQYLGFCLKYGRRLYGAPLPPVIDVDRPHDIEAAERLLRI